MAKRMTKEDAAVEEDSDRLGTIRAILTTIIIVIITMKAIIRTTEAAEEVEVEVEAEAEADEDPVAVEDEDIKAIALIQIITTGRIIAIIMQTLMHRTRIRIIINSNYLLLLRNINNNRNSNSSSNSSSNSKMPISVTTGAGTATIINEIFAGEVARNYMSVPYHHSVNDRTK